MGQKPGTDAGKTPAEQAEGAEPQAESTTETSEEKEPLTRKEYERQQKAAAIEEERANPSSRFKKKAMERAAERERIAQEKYDRQNDENKGFRKRRWSGPKNANKKRGNVMRNSRTKNPVFPRWPKNAPLYGKPKGKSVWLEETGNEIEFSGKKKIGCFSNLFLCRGGEINKSLVINCYS